jgi:hypothetical protein
LEPVSTGSFFFIQASVTAALSRSGCVWFRTYRLQWPGTQGAALLLNKQNSIK